MWCAPSWCLRPYAGISVSLRWSTTKWMSCWFLSWTWLCLLCSSCPCHWLISLKAGVLLLRHWCVSRAWTAVWILCCITSLSMVSGSEKRIRIPLSQLNSVTCQAWTDKCQYNLKLYNFLWGAVCVVCGCVAWRTQGEVNIVYFMNKFVTLRW